MGLEAQLQLTKVLAESHEPPSKPENHFVVSQLLFYFCKGRSEKSSPKEACLCHPKHCPPAPCPKAVQATGNAGAQVAFLDLGLQGALPKPNVFPWFGWLRWCVLEPKTGASFAGKLISSARARCGPHPSA